MLKGWENWGKARSINAGYSEKKEGVKCIMLNPMVKTTHRVERAILNEWKDEPEHKYKTFNTERTRLAKEKEKHSNKRKKLKRQCYLMAVEAARVVNTKFKAYNKLSLRQKKVIKNLMEGKDRQTSINEAGYSKTTQATTVIGSKAMQASFRELLEENGLDDKSLIAAHRELVNATKPIPSLKKDNKNNDINESSSSEDGYIQVPDWQARSRGLDMAYKVKGHYAAEQHEVTVETHEQRLRRLMGGLYAGESNEAVNGQIPSIDAEFSTLQSHDQSESAGTDKAPERD